MGMERVGQTFGVGLGDINLEAKGGRERERERENDEGSAEAFPKLF